jgi:hypothetical protein
MKSDLLLRQFLKSFQILLVNISTWLLSIFAKRCYCIIVFSLGTILHNVLNAVFFRIGRGWMLHSFERFNTKSIKISSVHVTENSWLNLYTSNVDHIFCSVNLQLVEAHRREKSLDLNLQIPKMFKSSETI